MQKLVIIFSILFLLGACSTKNCRTLKEEEAQKNGTINTSAPINKEIDPMAKVSEADRIKVYKFDGSLQCGMGAAISISEMQKDLGSIKVFSSFNKNDGMMRIQLCGSPTGNCNVYEIDKKDLADAIKKGFKEWTFE